MSAWICTDYHLNALANFARDKRADYYWGNIREGFTDPQRIVEVLQAENYRSVNNRYRDEYGNPPPIKFQMGTSMLVLKPVDILKACHCLNYQSCESDDWNETEAKAILEAIEHAAMRALPGYDASPWGLEPPAEDSEVFSLSDMFAGRA